MKNKKETTGNLKTYKVVWADIHTVVVQARNKAEAADQAKRGNGVEFLDNLLPIDVDEV